MNKKKWRQGLIVPLAGLEFDMSTLLAVLEFGMSTLLPLPPELLG